MGSGWGWFSARELTGYRTNRKTAEGTASWCRLLERRGRCLRLAVDLGDELDERRCGLDAMPQVAADLRLERGDPRVSVEPQPFPDHRRVAEQVGPRTELDRNPVGGLIAPSCK